MKTLYLHIGLPKTATSTIQHALDSNRQLLKPRNYLIPDDTPYPNSAAFALFEVIQQHKPDAYIDPLLNTIKTAPQDNIILSSEYFTYAKPYAPQRLKQLFDGIAQIKIVVYLRRQDKWLQSAWAQAIKTGAAKTDFPTSVDRVLQGKVTGHSRVIRYFEFLESWAAVFGREAILVHTFEDMLASEYKPYEHFLTVCGIEPDKFWHYSTSIHRLVEMISKQVYRLILQLPKDRRRDYLDALDQTLYQLDRWHIYTRRLNLPSPDAINPSPSIKTIETIRYIQTQFEGSLPVSILNELLSIMNALGWNTQKMNVIDEETYHKIMAAVEDTNRAVAQTYFNRDELFPTTFDGKPLTTFNVNDLKSDEITHLIQQFAPVSQISNPTLDDLIKIIRQAM